MLKNTQWDPQLAVKYSKNKIACELLDGLAQDEQYELVDGVIYYKGRIYLVLESALKKKIMEASHDSPLAGHPGYLEDR